MIPALRVVQPGILTTIQDIGRPNAVPSGVSTGGAMDRFAHSAANLLVGNERTAATLECTLTGPRLIAERALLVAVTGGEFEIRINGLAAPMWSGLLVRAGDELAFASRSAGARAYVAVAGGIAGDRWLGSMSTNLLCARGGMKGRAIVAGDVIFAGEPPATLVADRELAPNLRPPYEDHTLRVIPGPHFGRLGAESRGVLFESTYTVHHDSNRMGYRLDGPRLDAPGDEILSFAVIAGAIQLPSGGQPIVLMADHQTAGGYPVIAAVASAWMPVAAQLAPGDEVRFAEISIDDALATRAFQRAALESLTS